jgi:signal transduction histidine kinase
MSSFAAGFELQKERVGVTAWLARPRVRTAVAISGLAVALGAGRLVATSGHLVDPLAYGLEIAVIVGATTWIALYWAARRPGNRVAVGLLAYAAFIACLSLQGAANPLLHSVGVLTDIVAFTVGYYVIFMFPEERLRGLLEKVLLAGVILVVDVPFLMWFFFSPVVAGGAPLAQCNASCPRNALMIADKPTVADGFGSTETDMSVVLAAAIVAGLCYRLIRASRPRRRALLPVYVPAFMLTVPWGIFWLVQTGLFALSPDTVHMIARFVTTGRILLSFGFLLAIVQAMFFAGVAMKTILSRLGENEDPAHLQGLVADALDDPTIELGFEVDRGSGAFVDPRGHRLDPTRLEADRSATLLERRGATVAYMVHDSVLDTDPELVQAAGQAVLLALQSGRLEVDLQTKVAELRESRGRIVAVGDAERRRIERDLHDGAQQRLMAIQVRLGLAKEHAGDEALASELEAIREDAAVAVEELRALARGIYPTVLLERGVADAVRSLAMTAPVPIDVTDSGIGRCPPGAEAAIYFCVLEAVQNTVKHAGRGARVSVMFDRSPGHVEFIVSDDGVGTEPGAVTTGTGLIGMRDRIGAVGGELEITSRPGEGTSVRGTVPDAGPPAGSNEAF